ncbi:MAG TPA: hypothetical protein VHE30_25185 [Polyangiaceae bacterium]|nr:hypothetical protein [Polyangiaceae bacterium]
MTAQSLEGRIAAAVTARDYFRRSQFGLTGRSGHKEWLHFAVYADGVDLLVNFSLVDDIRPRAPRGAELARITVLVRTKDGWDGDVEGFPSERVHVRGGRTDVSFAENHVRFLDGAFRIRVSLSRRPIEVDLALVPEVFPSEANNIDVEDGPAIHWMVLPRLSARGTVRVGARLHPLSNAPAYHDHNWGNFRWGKNFAWEWGYALPDDRTCPYSVVFVRLMDRGHRTDLMQAVFLWDGPRQIRVFRDSELRVRHEGLLAPERPFKLPRAMALVAPEHSTDVPRVLAVEAAGRGDTLEFEFRAEDLAQVVIPNDDDLGVTIINEVSGDLALSGEVAGRKLSFSGRSICEFLGA